jgi:hypothetical protein
VAALDARTLYFKKCTAYIDSTGYARCKLVFVNPEIGKFRSDVPIYKKYHEEDFLKTLDVSGPWMTFLAHEVYTF